MLVFFLHFKCVFGLQCMIITSLFFHVSYSVLTDQQSQIQATNNVYTLRNKGTKAVTGAVPFQKVHVCT